MADAPSQAHLQGTQNKNEMPEQQNIEYKESWHDDYLKWVCGFADAQGGSGTGSLSFNPAENKTVKIIVARGIENIKIIRL